MRRRLPKIIGNNFVNDVDRRTVRFMAKGWGKARLSPFYELRTAEQLVGIVEAELDMRKTLIAAAGEAVAVPSSNVVFDRFHVTQHMT